MDEGPFRLPRKSPEKPLRRVANTAAQPSAPTAPEPARSAPAAAPTDRPEPEAASSSRLEQNDRIAAQSNRTRRTTDKSKPQPNRNWLKPGIGFVAGLALALLLVWLWPRLTGPLIDSQTYQAVFSTNGQVYFGKLEPSHGEYLKLSNVYYVQSKSSDDKATDQNDLELIKLGSNEVYGPRDEMVFIKDQVLYYQNLDPDGKVATLIRDNQDGN